MFFDNYLVFGFVLIMVFVENVCVLMLIVVCMVQKFGFFGFFDFQLCFYQELEEIIFNLIFKYDCWVVDVLGMYILNCFVDVVVVNMCDSLVYMLILDFDWVVVELLNWKKFVYFVGGCIMYVLVDYFFMYLQVICLGVILILMNCSIWL